MNLRGLSPRKVEGCKGGIEAKGENQNEGFKHQYPLSNRIGY